MNRSKLISQRATKFPLLALLFVSALAVMFTGLRIERTRNWHYLGLVWNLFLAWLPLFFALAVYQRHQRGERSGWRLWGLGCLWLLFFPNAPYIFTDLIHLTPSFRANYWMDLSLILLLAGTGFLLGFVSLYLMQSVVAERLGRVAGWLFIAAAAWASGFGVYLGRFLRWNSWDVAVHPLGLSHSIGHLAAHPLANPASVVFPADFATFLFLGYLMLYALTHLQPGRAQGAAA